MNSAATNKEESEQVSFRRLVEGDLFSFSNEQLDDEQADLDNILDNISIPASIIQFMCEECGSFNEVDSCISLPIVCEICGEHQTNVGFFPTAAEEEREFRKQAEQYTGQLEEKVKSSAETIAEATARIQ